MSIFGIDDWMVILLITILSVLVLMFYIYNRKRKILKMLGEIEQEIERITGFTEIPGLDPEWKKSPAKIKERYHKILDSLNQLKADTMTDIELITLDVEEDLRGLHFKKCEKNLEGASRKLKVLEEKINDYFQQIKTFGEILIEIDGLKTDYHKIRQKVERRIDELRFQYSYSFHSLKEYINGIDREYIHINELEEQGDFEDVKSKLEALLDRNRNLMELLQRVPAVRQTIEKELSQELRQLYEDVQEMIQGDFGGDPDAIYAEMLKIKGKGDKLPRLFEEGKIEEVERKIMEVREDIENLYKSMEDIFENYHQYCSYLNELPHYLQLLKDDSTYLTEELNDLSERFQVNGGDVFYYNCQIDALISEIEGALDKVAATGDKVSYLRFKEMVVTVADRAKKLLEQREQMIQELKDLRKGETLALEEIRQLRSDVGRVEQQLKRLYLPGMPEVVNQGIVLARRAIEDVEKSLNDIPLNMGKVNHYLKEARAQTIDLLENATKTIQYSQNTEQRIQQSNRYRRHDREIDSLLHAAETAYRSLDFELSSQLADQAYEIVKSKYRKE